MTRQQSLHADSSRALSKIRTRQLSSLLNFQENTDMQYDVSYLVVSCFVPEQALDTPAIIDFAINKKAVITR